MHINPFYATYFFLYPLKTLENFPFFQDYRKRLSGTKQIEKCQSISDLAIFFITGLDIKIVDRNNFLEISTSLHQREVKMYLALTCIVFMLPKVTCLLNPLVIYFCVNFVLLLPVHTPNPLCWFHLQRNSFSCVGYFGDGTMLTGVFRTL